MTFNAKKTFTDFSPDAKALRAIVETPAFHVGVAFALAQMATNGATKDEMQGADVFVQILCNIGEKTEPMPKFPVKTLATYEQDYKPGEKKDK